MRRWLVESFGNPGEVWRLEDDAESFEPESDQLKIDVEAAGLGLPDVLMCNNNYPLTPPLPFTPSQEAAGKVVAVGENVDKRLIGTRVLGPTLFQAQRGGLAESCLMHAASALPIPDAMSGVEAVGCDRQRKRNHLWQRCFTGARPRGGKAGRAAFKALAFEGRFLVTGYAIEHIAAGKVEGKVVVRL